MQLDQQIQQAAALIAQANHLVAMTGAGISTPSGIPDFRSPHSGLWDHADPLEVASIFSFRHSPQHFYNWVRPLSSLLFEAQPNPAHYALAALEQEGKLKAVITQNIDNLHGKAGSKTVYELHGHLRQVTCLRCYQTQDSTEVFAKFLDDGQVPRHSCGGVLKPNVILFGEQLPVQEFVLAQLAVQAADLMLVVGSSLEVAPASDLPELALENSAKLIIINYQPTYLDPQADLVIQADVATVLPRIVDLVRV
ncbi:MAG: Sir2 family NAD-dependent protein deacetylase [Chloroflexi bacterium]|nr:Sir2 family NAD-dependent protein deacetylase [Chloroflexota bacterium]